MSGKALPCVLAFRAIHDEPIRSRLTAILNEYWPAYERWLDRSDTYEATDYRSKVLDYMPELLPVFDRLLESFGIHTQIARFLSLYNPPRMVRGCSQIVLDDDEGPVLLRSYDHHPERIDALVIKSSWLEHDVLAMSDCIWGALDGVNEHGLAVSLAFGGRDRIGNGFAAPLIVRYILETCHDVDAAKQVLSRVPVYMPYTFLVVDASGAFVTAHAGPDMETRFIPRRASTNHQSPTDWPAYRRQTQSVERLGSLESMLETHPNVKESLDAFLHPPLWRTDYARASGTLYVAAYHTKKCVLTLHWPGLTKVFDLDSFEEDAFEVSLA